eukprot:1048148-Amphidinium_carterae.1
MSSSGKPTTDCNFGTGPQKYTRQVLVCVGRTLGLGVGIHFLGVVQSDSDPSKVEIPKTLVLWLARSSHRILTKMSLNLCPPTSPKVSPSRIALLELAFLFNLTGRDPNEDRFVT